MQAVEWLFGKLNVPAITAFGVVNVGKVEGDLHDRVIIFERESIALNSNDGYHGETVTIHVVHHSRTKQSCLSLSTAIIPLIQPDLANKISSAYVNERGIVTEVEGTDLYRISIEIIVKLKV